MGKEVIAEGPDAIAPVEGMGDAVVAWVGKKHLR